MTRKKKIWKQCKSHLNICNIARAWQKSIKMVWFISELIQLYYTQNSPCMFSNCLFSLQWRYWNCISFYRMWQSHRTDWYQEGQEERAISGWVFCKWKAFWRFNEFFMFLYYATFVAFIKFWFHSLFFISFEIKIITFIIKK